MHFEDQVSCSISLFSINFIIHLVDLLFIVHAVISLMEFSYFQGYHDGFTSPVPVCNAKASC